MITAADFSYPFGIPRGFFKGKLGIPGTDYSIYRADFHIHFLRYLYYLCFLKDGDPYPIDMGLDDILSEFERNKGKDCFKRIRMILFGEAPPVNPDNYFYESTHWNAIKGKCIHGQNAWVGEIHKALFPKRTFKTKVDFLIACAKKGFLLIDLFPYSISYKRTSAMYRNACISAFGAGASPYPYNMLSVLNRLKCCIKDEIVIGFGLIGFGNTILGDASCVAAFSAWSSTNRISLNPIGPIETIRTAPIIGASDYLRVCGSSGPAGPTSSLLNLAGFI